MSSLVVTPLYPGAQGLNCRLWGLLDGPCLSGKHRQAIHLKVCVMCSRPRVAIPCQSVHGRASSRYDHPSTLPSQRIVAQSTSSLRSTKAAQCALDSFLLSQQRLWPLQQDICARGLTMLCSGWLCLMAPKCFLLGPLR